MPVDQQPPACGVLTVIRGCMFAGKTARLIERLAAARASGRRVLAFKHVLDTRYDPARLMTHDGLTLAAVAVGAAAEIEARVGDAEVVGIDEAQFFGRKLIPVVRRLVERGRDISVAGIDHDAWGQLFPPLPELAESCSLDLHLRVPCRVCGRPAELSQRMVPVVDGQMVGGPGEYEPRCAACFVPLPGPAPTYGDAPENLSSSREG